MLNSKQKKQKGKNRHGLPKLRRKGLPQAVAREKLDGIIQELNSLYEQGGLIDDEQFAKQNLQSKRVLSANDIENLKKTQQKRLLRKAAILDLCKSRCFYCGRKITLETMTLDHYVPKSKGGQDKNNLVAACKGCNVLKGSLSITEFRVLFSRVNGSSRFFSETFRNLHSDNSISFDCLHFEKI